MDLVRAIILGIVQGLTEFIPVSSSGHLILVPALFEWPDQGLAFDVGLHLGTLAALLVYFYRDWLRLIGDGLSDITQKRLQVTSYSYSSQFLGLLAVGSVPAAIVGLSFDDWIEENAREPWIVAIALAVAGIVMFISDRYARRQRAMDSIGLADALIVGVAQAMALIPGVSRSGATISAALWIGLRRPDAARFAFLLGTPAFIGAALLELGNLGGESNVDTTELIVGMVTSGVVGLFAIRFLLLYLQRGGLKPFVAYRLVVAALTLVIAGLRVM